jgi:hypothetical protein
MPTTKRKLLIVWRRKPEKRGTVLGERLQMRKKIRPRSIRAKVLREERRCRITDVKVLV